MHIRIINIMYWNNSYNNSNCTQTIALNRAILYCKMLLGTYHRWRVKSGSFKIMQPCYVEINLLWTNGGLCKNARKKSIVINRNLFKRCRRDIIFIKICRKKIIVFIFYKKQNYELINLLSSVLYSFSLT